MNMWNKLKWRLRDAWYTFRALPETAVRFWRWFPIIWRDRDYDYACLLTIMQFKLSQMRKHIVEHNIIVSAPKIGKDIKLAETLIQRILDDEYTVIEDKHHEKQYGTLQWRSKPIKDEGCCESEFCQRMSEMDIYNEKARIEGKDEAAREERSRIHALGVRRRNDDLDYLFKHIRKNLERWWD